MACFSPLAAWKSRSGEIVFAPPKSVPRRPGASAGEARSLVLAWLREHQRTDVSRELVLPCGQCIGCKLERSRVWAIRCMHEAQMHKKNCFITLTYNDNNLPMDLSLRYPDFQLFMRRMRKRLGRVRFYMAGEYGEQYGRPHYHACLFGLDFDDRMFYRRLPSGSSIYTSKVLESLWPFGFSSVADVTFESAAYVARYCTKKVSGSAADAHYQRVRADTGEIVQAVPEFNVMSRRPGIGANWLMKYADDVYHKDHVIMRGQELKPPRFYDNMLKEADHVTFEAIELGRSVRAAACAADNTNDRLRVREVVTRARMSFNKRTLE